MSVSLARPILTSSLDCREKNKTNKLLNKGEEITNTAKVPLDTQTILTFTLPS